MNSRSFLRSLSDEYLVLAAKDIFDLGKTGVWPGGTWPDWIEEVTQEIGAPFSARMGLAVMRIKDEIMRRFIRYAGKDLVRQGIKQEDDGASGSKKSR